MGSSKFILGLRERLLEALPGMFPVTVGSMKSIWRIHWAGKEDVGRIYRWLYTGEDDLGLRRKKVSLGLFVGV